MGDPPVTWVVMTQNRRPDLCLTGFAACRQNAPRFFASGESCGTAHRRLPPWRERRSVAPNSGGGSGDRFAEPADQVGHVLLGEVLRDDNDLGVRDAVSRDEHTRAAGLAFFGDLAPLADQRAFAAAIAPLRRSEWVGYAKRPFAGPQAVLAYLSRYTQRVASRTRV
jgi:hypothetical protein